MLFRFSINPNVNLNVSFMKNTGLRMFIIFNEMKLMYDKASSDDHSPSSCEPVWQGVISLRLYSLLCFSKLSKKSGGMKGGQRGGGRENERHERVWTVFCETIHSLRAAAKVGVEFRESRGFSAEIKRGWTLTVLNPSALQCCSQGLPLKFKDPAGALSNAQCQ